MTAAPALPLEAAQARLLALRGPLPVERCAIPEAVGRYLAEPINARRTQPAADMSAMDGYGVRADDLAGPWTIIGESAAGRPLAGEPGRGEAVRVSTGALLPPGAGAVIVQEDVARDAARLVLTGEPPSPADRHIRRAGMDFRAGSPLLAAGTRIGPASAALAVAAGHRMLAVHARPHVAVIDSGDELCGGDEAPDAPHRLPASNGVMLAAMIAALPATVRRIGPVPDRLDRLVAAFDEAGDADVIVTSGGASVGDHDLVAPALAAYGATLVFWRVAIRPGKPLLVATRARPGEGPRGPQVIVGLPGNPGSSFVTAHLFVLPLLRALLGAGEPLPRTFEARLAAPLAAVGSRREFLRARWDGATIAADVAQDSGALTALARSNALIDRPPGAAAVAAGETVRGHLLENGGAF